VDIYDEPEPYLSPAEQRVRIAGRAVAGVVIAAGIVVASFLGLRVASETLLGQCAPPWLTGTDPQLCLSASVDRDQLTISGTTSLPDGAVVEVWAEDGGTTYGEHWQTDQASAAVSGGAFSYVFDLSGWGAGTVTAHAEFWVGPGQPSDVVHRYGDNGQNLVGPEVQFDNTVAGDNRPRGVQVSVDVDLSAGLAP